MTVRPEALAAATLREYLLLQLPSAVATVNLERAAVLKAPGAGPYTIPSNAVLKVSKTDKAGTTTSIPLTAGSRATAQLVTEINATVANLASADTEDRLTLTSDTTPSGSTLSVVAVGADSTGANSAIGWDVAGEWVVRTALVAPGNRGVADGLPLGGFFEPSQLGNGRVLVTIGDRSSTPTRGNPRLHEWDCLLEVGVFRAEPQQVVHQTRDGIQAAVEAVRSIVNTVAGRQAGSTTATVGTILYSEEKSCMVAGLSYRFQRQETGAASPVFDMAKLKLLVRVYQP